MATVAATGVILAACYMLWMYRRVMHGEVTNPENEKLKDLSGREKAVLIPVVLVILAIGVFPRAFLSRTDASVAKLVTEYREAAGMDGLPHVTPLHGGHGGEDHSEVLELRLIDGAVLEAVVTRNARSTVEGGNADI
jgi:NADH-quinone oxidoreductase subunit M